MVVSQEKIEMLRIRVTSRFDNELEEAIKQGIELFRKNPQDTRLDNHNSKDYINFCFFFGPPEMDLFVGMFGKFRKNKIFQKRAFIGMCFKIP